MGGSYRGVKAKIAGEQGAIGLIIYSDPADDGYMKGDVYPRGPWRSADAIQRGTVKYIFHHAGDPLDTGLGIDQRGASYPNYGRRQISRKFRSRRWRIGTQNRCSRH